ncbi:MAG: ECF transporter S component [Firmicutes bacterium]|nr:ECF transporter S component [Bacillota bacterium]
MTRIDFQENKVKILTVGGLMAALIAVATGYLKIPTAIGYFHLGDGFIFMAAALLGPYGALAAAIGSALADLLASYFIYAPVTFVIKGLMGLIAAFCLNKQSSLPTQIIVMVLAEVLMVLGYFLFECLIYDYAAASAVIITNAMQGIIGVVFGTLLIKYVANKIELFK